MKEENREVEFKALTQENDQKLTWKIMEKARVFICSVLNNAGMEKGTIYFGVGDSYDERTNFDHGEIIGLVVSKDDINKAFQSTFNDHIISEEGNMKKSGDMNCIQIHFVPVEEPGEQTDRYVIEIEVKRDWKFCKDNLYLYKQWTEKKGKIGCGL